MHNPCTRALHPILTRFVLCRFKQLNPTAEWAQLPKPKSKTKRSAGAGAGAGSDDDSKDGAAEDEDDEDGGAESSLLSSAALSVSASSKLPPNVLAVTKLRDVMRPDHPDAANVCHYMHYRWWVGCVVVFSD